MSAVRVIPALHSLDEVAELSERGALSPDAQAVHVGHVSWFRGSWTKTSNNLHLFQFSHRAGTLIHDDFVKVWGEEMEDGWMFFF